MAKGGCMNYDIILVQAPANGPFSPSLALPMLSAVLKDNGFFVSCIDMNISMYRRRTAEHSDSWDLHYGVDIWEKPLFVNELLYSQRAYLQAIIEQILASNAKLVGFSVSNSSIVSSRLIANQLKRIDNNLKVVFGGPQVAAYLNSKSLLKDDDNIDAIVLGEGEDTIVELADLYCNDKPIYPVAGTYLKVDGKIIEGEVREPIKDLDSISYQDLSDFDLSMYTHPTNLRTWFSRGCINKCIYCSERAFMSPFRSRSGKRVFDEIVYLLNKYPRVNYFQLSDSVTNGKIKELEIFCELLIENKVKINWTIENAVIRKEMRAPLYKKLKEAGCDTVSYGLETASESLRLSIGKTVSKGVDIDKVTSEGATAGIRIMHNFMFGLPGETKEDFEEQKAFIKRNKKHIHRITPSEWICAFPKGSLGYENPCKYGINLKKSSRDDDKTSISFGSIYWESKDGQNNYIIRQKKIIEFCEIAKQLNIRSITGYPPFNNAHELIGDYYYFKDDIKKAKKEYNISLDTEVVDKYTLAEKLLNCDNKLQKFKRNSENIDKTGFPDMELLLDLQDLKGINEEIVALRRLLESAEERANRLVSISSKGLVGEIKAKIKYRLSKFVIRCLDLDKLVYRMISSLEVIDAQIKAIKISNQRKSEDVE